VSNDTIRQRKKLEKNAPMRGGAVHGDKSVATGKGRKGKEGICTKYTNLRRVGTDPAQSTKDARSK
jgi:hypothetical protein